MRRRLRFNPHVPVLTDSQIHAMILEDEARARREPDPPPAASRSRRGFLRTSALGVSTAAVLTTAAASAASPKRRFRLPELYPGQNTALFQEILNDEAAHVQILQRLLDDDENTLPKRPVPNLRNLLQPNVLAFVQAAAAFENTGTGTYAGALFAIEQSEEYFPVAAGLATVEARHAGFLNALLNGPLVPDFFPVDSSIPQSVALSHVDPFIADLNGGTVPSFDPDHVSDENNFAIQDFLLLLEMVETAFYQVNVAKFFA